MLRTIDFPLGVFKFSAGHFTIFSATEREALHGHTYKVGASLQLTLDKLGLNFDYRKFKAALTAECKKLNTIFLLPQDSEFLDIEADAEYVAVTFDNKSMRLLRSDVLLLPLTNITIELLSGYLLDSLLLNNGWLKECAMTKLSIAVANTDKQSATAEVCLQGA